MKKAVLLVSHGSRSSRAREEIEALAADLKKSSAGYILETAFLDVEHPTIPEGVERCIKMGASEILILQHFLNSGTHVLDDIPATVKKLRNQYPDTRIFLTPFLGSHPKISELYLEILREAEGTNRWVEE